MWLVQHDLLYTDLRAPNVLLGGAGEGAGGGGAGGSAQPAAQGSISAAPAKAEAEAAYLVDYDDMRVVPGLWADVFARGTQAIADAFSQGV